MAAGLGAFGDASNCWIDTETKNSFCDYTIDIRVTNIPATNTAQLIEEPLCKGLNDAIEKGDMHALTASLSSSSTDGWPTWTWTGKAYPRINMSEKVNNKFERSPFVSSMAGNKIRTSMED